ncbi:unnamed protein product [Caenorhabditis nigoni]
MPIKLLDFPVDIQARILNELAFTELFKFAQCSKRSGKKAKLAHTKELKLELNLSSSWIMIDNVMKIEAQKFRLGDERKVTGFQYFDDMRAAYYYENPTKMISFWENRTNGLKTMFVHFSNLFECPTHSVRSDASVPATTFLLIVHKITSSQQEIKSLDIAAKSLVENNVRWILDKLTITEELTLGEKLSDDFGRNNQIRFDAKQIFIFNASWICPQNLAAMKNCVSIELDGTVLIGQDVVKFFEEWREGMYQNLEYLSLKSEKLKHDFTLPGFDKLEQGEQIYHKLVNNRHKIIRGYVSIWRNDGVEGRVRYDKNYREVQMLV